MSSTSEVPPFFDGDTVPDDRQATEHEAETWIPQGDAAARTGFSVSAIRKWRRMGVVAERKVTTGTDLPRVEVKLEDVLARAAMQPQRRPLAPPDADTPAAARAGCLVIGIGDLEELFERMVRAERRAESAEAEVKALEVQAHYMLGRVSELRRQLDAQGVPAADVRHPGQAPARTFPKPAPVPASRAEAGVTRARTGTATGTGASALRRAPVAVIGVPAHPPAHRHAPVVAAPAPPTEVEGLARQLRAIYARLDEYRSEPTISSALEARRQRELAEYDQALLAACAALGVPTGLPPGAAVGVDARARLTGALARAGLDVRANGDAGPRRARTRWPTVRPRP